MDKIVFEDYPNESTPITAEVLNKIQENIENALNELKNKQTELEKKIVPTGGTTGKVLIKNSNKDNDCKWGDVVLDEKYEPASIVATLSSKQSISTGAYITVKLNTQKKVGNYFNLDTKSNTIKVLKDCETIVSANVFIDGSAGEGYVMARVTLNSTDITTNLARIIDRDYTQSSVPAIHVSLKANDVLKLSVDYSSGSGYPAIRNASDYTFLSIVKI